MNRYFIILILIIMPAIACVTEGTIWEELDTSNDKAVIQSEEPCDNCTLESQ